MTPALPDPKRIDALVDGATANDGNEEDLLDLVSELRADTVRAPQALRARVERLAETAPTRRRWAWRPAWPALAGALAPVMAAAAITVAVWPTAAPSPRGELEQVQAAPTSGTNSTYRSKVAPPRDQTPAPSPPGASAATASKPTGGESFDSAAAAEPRAPATPTPVRVREQERPRWPYVAGLGVLSLVLAIGFGWTKLRPRWPMKHP